MPSYGKREGTGRRMRATVVRFGEEQFEELKAEAAFAGVSVAEYVRQAVVARIAHNSALRSGAVPAGSRAESSAARARHEAQRVRSESTAVRAESEQARSQMGNVTRRVHADREERRRSRP